MINDNNDNDDNNDNSDDNNYDYDNDVSYNDSSNGHSNEEDLQCIGVSKRVHIMSNLNITLFTSIRSQF